MGKGKIYIDIPFQSHICNESEVYTFFQNIYFLTYLTLQILRDI